MFISKLSVKNFRPFSSTSIFVINSLNVPNATDEGSGLNILVGENGCGKTTLLDALVLPLLEYKADSIHLDDFQNKDESIEIQILANTNFSYDGTMPKVAYTGKGLNLRLKFAPVEAQATSLP